MSDNDATADVPEWSPPAVDEATGVSTDGGYPINHRLRAEAIAAEGLEADPDGLITPELIADAKARVEAETADREAAEAAEAKAHPPVTPSMTVAKIEQIAKKEGVDLTPASNNEERVDLINAARTEGSADV